MNPNPVAAGHFRDVAGNPLAQTTGSFTTQGATSSGCTNQSNLAAAGFGLFKQTNHRQDGTGAPVEDATLGAMFQAFSSITNPVNRAALSFGGPPPVLQFLSVVGNLQFLSKPYPNQAALDGDYPSGTYSFQLRQPTNTVIASADLVLPVSPYPNVPHFANYTAAQSIDTNVDFTLTWDAFTGATTNDSLHIEILDENGNSLLSLPDPCSGPGLPATATSVVLPRGLLPGGQNLTAILTFNKSNDYGKFMPGTTAKGVAATSRITRMGLHTTGGTPPPPPAPARFLSITKVDPTTISITATGSVNRVYVLETSATVNTGWLPLVTNNAGASGIFIVPIDPSALAPRRFFRAIGR